MIRASDLTEKEVINITDGRRLGLISDIDVNLEKGKINAIIVPNSEKFFGLFGKELENEITWVEIKKIGIDVILVEVKNNIEPHLRHYEEDEDFFSKEGKNKK
ncbi:YlmC/YmxH family sporulation protein [Clostridium formicaceticum]|uniref:PRC-barrel domain protein n=1 Tax=Clostridium formicaceticum TaxID=1497 RepID=A0AAC9WGI0_9CLOT|nr:YlmC/YmxH family sporulation protein [Clostridium formicaceticum]AOY77418.1 photosystem reaction center protein H [Clostridium formicaceticum]ARE87972.1 PRC-barrel domain protein [Clostridium formicaceticum]